MGGAEHGAVAGIESRATFLFTDIEASTRRWETHPELMRPALERHDALIVDAVESHRGTVFKHTGDGACARFERARDAVEAAADAQQALLAED
jgi:class 3 adenylate cyclase